MFPELGSGVGMWDPAGVAFPSAPFSAVSPALTCPKPDFHHSTRTQAPLSAKGQWQPGVSHYKLSELDKDLGDLVQPSCVTE